MWRHLPQNPIFDEIQELANIRKVDIYLANPKCEAVWKVEWLACEKD
jgi:hypothetical protein